jgi:hypothetical protein
MVELLMSEDSKPTPTPATPEQCLETLHQVAEQVAMSGPSRDIARAAHATVAAALTELAALRIALSTGPQG